MECASIVSDIAWIARRSHRKVIPAGTEMIQQGVASDVIYFIVDGSASVVVDGVGGKWITFLR